MGKLNAFLLSFHKKTIDNTVVKSIESMQRNWWLLCLTYIISYRGQGLTKTPVIQWIIDPKTPVVLVIATARTASCTLVYGSNTSRPITLVYCGKPSSLICKFEGQSISIIEIALSNFYRYRVFMCWCLFICPYVNSTQGHK